ncbi:unnamed protein product [Protopolystoma xenopodis]|uniref:Uncharacterized protein n=1 Tax=Protopolystoma xenopodis TaxID=117903 RepID=A0A448WLM8_9PLAT|nr:unnamed protein product [Protopolystoma xenopodis]
MRIQWARNILYYQRQSKISSFVISPSYNTHSSSVSGQTSTNRESHLLLGDITSIKEYASPPSATYPTTASDCHGTPKLEALSAEQRVDNLKEETFEALKV